MNELRVMSRRMHFIEDEMRVADEDQRRVLQEEIDEILAKVEPLRVANLDPPLENGPLGYGFIRAILRSKQMIGWQQNAQ